MGLYYSVEMQQKLVHYIQLIARWNKTFNLTAIRDVEEMVSKHLLDSLVVQPFVEGSLVLDVGRHTLCYYLALQTFCTD